jgi:hypothetical protein
VKCPKCGAENPDYGYYCGLCASELRGGDKAEAGKGAPRRAEPRTKIESILRRNQVRIGENVARRRRGMLAKLGGLFRPSGTFIFKSEYEEVSLSVDKEGHVSVSSSPPAKIGLMLEGPHDSFLTMFRDERSIGDIPIEIDVRAEGFALPDDERLHDILRSSANKALRDLFE